jgi:gliding motility-associated-like protein
MRYFYSLLFFVVCLIGIQTKINAQASCAAAAPFCTSSGVSFPASTNTTAATGPNYGCLLSQPNPAWYYLNISTSGNIQINLTNSANVDIDFIIWGPFASQAAMCGGLNNSGIDCSFSTAANEQVDIPNAVAGQWYMLLITNFSGQPTNISATAQNAPGTDGTTNCAILCNMTGLTANPGACVSPANTFTLTGTVTATNPPSTGTMTVTSSCGGSQIFNPPFAGSINYTLPNIPANGAPCTVTATYSADPTCTLTTNYVAPPSCNVVACNISNFTANISACAVATNTYTVNGAVTFTNPPATGTMTVTTCGGNSQTFNAPFVSPINYNITGIPADGTTNCNVTVVFSAAGACTQTVGPFTEPVCLCNMDNMAVNVGTCDPITTTYSVTVDLTFTSPPSTGNLQVTVCGVTQNIPMPATSPQTFTFTGLTPDGLACNAVSSFTAAPACGNTVPFTAPTGCDCVVDAGTFTDNIVGSGTTNYLLCFNDVLDITSNGNMVDPNVSLNNPGVIYDPGLWLLAYSCPPTIFPQDDLLNDPCLLGVADDTDGDWSILNNIGDGSTVYFVPVTMYSMVNGTYSATDFAGSCYDFGPVYSVTFLPEVLATGVESCPNGTVTVTVSGGVPATTGGNFTASNLSPATASFNNTTASNNGTIVISGLTNGQIYSFDIADANGCPVTFTGGPFVGPVATSINPAGPFCLSDPSVNLVDVPATTGTYTGTGITNAANGTFDPTTAGLGIHTITYTPTGCFLPSTVNISVNDIFDATINPAGPFCASNGNTFLGAVDAGGTWSGTGIVGGTNTTGEFSPSLAGAGNHNITYTILGACGDVGTTVIQVIADADATITPAGPFCISDPAVNLVGAQTGGVWSGTGITSAANGTFNPATAGAGTHTITYNIAGVCGDVQTSNITVISLFPSTITPVGPFCQNAASVNLVGATPGGTWSGTGITNTVTGTFNPNTAGPGTHTITYTLGGNCGTSSTLNIVVNPLPVPTFSADVLSGCAPLTVTLTDNTIPAASSTVWTIVGETSSNNNGSFIYTFNNPGVYSVTLTLTSAAGCVGTTTINNMINVFPNPVADFSFGPSGADITNSLINFTNESSLNDLNNWDFGGLGSSTQANPSFTFPSDSPGNYNVCLAIETANGCVDTTCQTIIINDIFIIYVPNAFTPNEDGINDYFLPILSGFDPLSYELIIFNRWGELIFESQSQGVWWDGTHKGILCQDDVYVWKIKVKDAIENKKREYIGHVSLLK